LGSANEVQGLPNSSQRPTVALAAPLRLMVLGASHRSMGLASREALLRALAGDADFVGRIPEIREHAVLATCNRIEIYFVAASPEVGARTLREAIADAGGPEGAESSGFFVLQGLEAVRHLFEVAAGLDSVVLGEPQILAQVRGAGAAARKSGKAKGIISPLFDRAFRVGTRVRAAYRLGSGERSLSDLAMEVVSEVRAEWSGLLLIGTGKMVRLAVKRLGSKPRRVYVASRRSRAPPGLSEAKVIGYSGITNAVKRCDVVVSATNTRIPLLGKEDLDDGRRRVVVDLGMPRNVSASVRGLPNVTLIDLDDLARRAEGAGKPKEVEPARRAAAAEAAEFYNWVVQTRLSTILAEIFTWADSVREAEVKRALGRLKLGSSRESRAVEAMGRRLVSRMLARPARFAHRRYKDLTEEEKLDLLGSVFGIGDADDKQ
jgi:glutamyl-tRNA reductase